MKDYERIEKLENDVRILRAEISRMARQCLKVIEHVDTQSNITAQTLQTAKSTLEQNERLLKDLETLMSGTTTPKSPSNHERTP